MDSKERNTNSHSLREQGFGLDRDRTHPVTASCKYYQTERSLLGNRVGVSFEFWSAGENSRRLSGQRQKGGRDGKALGAGLKAHGADLVIHTAGHRGDSCVDRLGIWEHH